MDAARTAWKTVAKMTTSPALRRLSKRVRGVTRVAAALGIAYSLSGSGCQIVGGYQSFQGHPCNALPASKPDKRNLATLVLSKQPDGTCYWIDQTEVTVEQYVAFVGDASRPVNWDPTCTWKTTPSDPIHETTNDTCIASTAVESEPFRMTKPIPVRRLVRREGLLQLGRGRSLRRKHQRRGRRAAGFAGPVGRCLFRGRPSVRQRVDASPRSLQCRGPGRAMSSGSQTVRLRTNRRGRPFRVYGALRHGRHGRKRRRMGGLVRLLGRRTGYLVPAPGRVVCGLPRRGDMLRSRFRPAWHARSHDWSALLRPPHRPGEEPGPVIISP